MKRAFHLLPFRALRAVSFILAIGEEKHGRDTWRELPFDVHFDACLSHIAYWASGQKIDPDTGESHLWNALTRLMFCVELEIGNDTLDEEIRRSRANFAPRLSSSPDDLAA